MNSSQSLHPHPDQLQAFAGGRLQGQAAVDIERHLAGCALCAQMLAALPKQTLVSLLQHSWKLLLGRPTVSFFQDPEAKLPKSPKASEVCSTEGEYEADSPRLPAVPGYEILEELGRGGMGVVYKARQVGLNRVVALKMILSGEYAGAAELARFKTEAEAIARLQHPNIVQIHEVAEHNGLPFFSLEFCPGGSLGQKLAGTPLPPREGAALLEKLARAMQAAHERGVIHRDLKPANVLLGDDGTPKITDFGLAKRVEREAQSPEREPEGAARSALRALTQTGAVMGTPSYMPPEQAGGRSKQIGPAADVYALGAILYECLTGRPPFKGPTPVDTILQVLSQEAVPPSRLQPRLPRDLETICLKCLQKQPHKRYPDAAELAEDLRRFLAGEPILARPVGALERTWKWVKRRPAASALIAVLVLGSAVALALAVWALGERDDAITARKFADQKSEETEKERKKAERQAALTLFEEALFRCEQEGASRGMLWLARSLKEALRAEASDLEDSIRQQLAAWNRNLHPLKAVLSHQGGVVAVAFSPDGKTVLTGGDKTARLWQADTGQPIGPTLPHQYAVDAVAFSPDGKTVLTGGDKTARLWQVDTGQPIGLPLKHQAEVRAMAFSPDGKTVLTGSADKTAQLWRTATGQPIGPTLQHQAEVMAVAFSPDGKTVLTASTDNRARLWQAATGQPITPPLKHQGSDKGALPFRIPAAGAVAFSPDGKTALTGGHYTAQIWEVATRGPIGPPLRHETLVVAVAFSPDGKTVLTGSHDKTARLWQAATGRPIGPPLQHQNAVVAVAFSADGKTVLTASYDKTARLWQSASAQPIGPPLQHRALVRAAVFSPDGNMVLTGSSDSTARLWQTATGRHIGSRLQHRFMVAAAAFSPDGKKVLTGSLDQTARLWQAATGQPIGAPLQHHHPIEAVAFSPDGRTVITGNTQLWQTDTGQPIGPPLKGFRAAAFSPDGKKVLTDSSDNTARLWQTATAQSIGPILKHRAEVMAVAFSPDGRTLLTGSADKTARLWDAATGKPIGPPLQHQHTVNVVTFSRDGKRVLTASEDKTARLWQAATGQPIGPPLRHQAEVRVAAFSSDGKTVLTASLDNTARLWQASTGQPIGPPLQHQNWVTVAAFSPDGNTVLTGSHDNTARLWQAATGQPIGPPREHESWLNVVAFSPDGKSLLTASGNTAQLWEAPTPPQGEPGRVILWVQVATGMELDEHGAVRVLDAATWHERRQQLEKLGGSPLP